jgi:5-deoxy-glucuronate isomerase
VVEVITPAGTLVELSAAQARHGCGPAESFLEETYYHRLDPPQGFAFQRVYTDDRSLDEAMTVEGPRRRDGAARLSPGDRPARLTSYYLNVMAGPQRVWHFPQRSRARLDARAVT